MERCIQTLFCRHFPSYQVRQKVSLRERQAAQSIMACRTAVLGGHVERCPNGHVVNAHFNSCKHRSCTLCNGLLKERWLIARKAKLLECPHYHGIFTVPHEFIPLWLYNRTYFMNLLFRGTHAALMTFLSDPKHLGATPGLLMSFHSWGRNLSVHPHVHCLITAGGLDDAGSWRLPKRSHFLPVKPLMLVFRGIMTKLLHEALETQQLALPPDTDRFDWHKRIKSTKAKAWNVHLRERYDHARGVACYLAKYVRGGHYVINSSRCTATLLCCVISPIRPNEPSEHDLLPSNSCGSSCSTSLKRTAMWSGVADCTATTSLHDSIRQEPFISRHLSIPPSS